jgi:hypothetical protein
VPSLEATASCGNLQVYVPPFAAMVAEGPAPVKLPNAVVPNIPKAGEPVATPQVVPTTLSWSDDVAGRRPSGTGLIVNEEFKQSQSRPRGVRHGHLVDDDRLLRRLSQTPCGFSTKMSISRVPVPPMATPGRHPRPLPWRTPWCRRDHPPRLPPTRTPGQIQLRRHSCHCTQLTVCDHLRAVVGRQYRRKRHPY